MKRAISAAKTFVLILTLAPATRAATVTTFDNPASFSAAVGGPSLTLDFDGVPGVYGLIVDGASFDPRVTFFSPEAADPTRVARFNDALSDAGSTTAGNNVGPLEGVLNVPARALALVFGSASTLETIELFGVTGNPLATVMPAMPNGFFAVQSDEPIARWIIRNGVFSPFARDRFSIDNFQAVFVPEPAAITLALLALLRPPRSKEPAALARARAAIRNAPSTRLAATRRAPPKRSAPNSEPPSSPTPANSSDPPLP